MCLQKRRLAAPCSVRTIPRAKSPGQKQNTDTSSYTFQYRRELIAKVKELEARASESRPQHVAHDIVRSEHATDAYLGFQGSGLCV